MSANISVELARHKEDTLMCLERFKVDINDAIFEGEVDEDKLKRLMERFVRDVNLYNNRLYEDIERGGIASSK